MIETGRPGRRESGRCYGERPWKKSFQSKGKSFQPKVLQLGLKVLLGPALLQAPPHHLLVLLREQRHGAIHHGSNLRDWSTHTYTAPTRTHTSFCRCSLVFTSTLNHFPATSHDYILPTRPVSNDTETLCVCVSGCVCLSQCAQCETRFDPNH